GSGDYARAADQLEALRHLADGCGGSRAQCDLLALTLLEANRRCGRMRRARALAAERLVRRPGSGFDQRLYASLAGSAESTSVTGRHPAADSDALPTAAQPGRRSRGARNTGSAPNATRLTPAESSKALAAQRSSATPKRNGASACMMRAGSMSQPWRAPKPRAPKRASGSVAMAIVRMPLPAPCR